MAAALVWPLNAAIQGPLASAQNLSIGQLLAGLPDHMIAYFRSYTYQELVNACVSVPRIPACAHTSREDLTLDCSLQDVFRHMLCAHLQAAQAIITQSGQNMEAVQHLLKTLKDCLDLDDNDLPRSMQAISQLDVGVTEKDQVYLLGMPVYASRRRPGSVPFTTYASLLWHTFEQVELAVSVHTSLQLPRMDMTSRFRSLHLTPEMGGTPYINVTPSINTTPMLSGTPKSSLTPRSYRNSPIHASGQRDAAGVKGACLACEEVIVRPLCPPKVVTRLIPRCPKQHRGLAE